MTASVSCSICASGSDSSSGTSAFVFSAFSSFLFLMSSTFFFDAFLSDDEDAFFSDAFFSESEEVSSRLALPVLAVESSDVFAGTSSASGFTAGNAPGVVHRIEPSTPGRHDARAAAAPFAAAPRAGCADFFSSLATPSLSTGSVARDRRRRRRVSEVSSERRVGS